ncbi:GatB/GatE catalytic domain-containing protein [Nemania serpens]|nr:GatB/GatE catalytic domain-containing protein [Nemania serpens]
MSHIRPSTLSRYLLHGQLISRGCLRTRARIQTRAVAVAVSHAPPARYLHIESTDPASNASAPGSAHVPLRKQLKDEAKRQKASGSKKKKNVNNQVVDGWELTVGIEIHAQLNTARKLFSAAATSFHDDPNTHVAYFDLATPGSQPIFQKETLLPALRAALALGCEIQPVSRFDRKHYFHWDQPAGYQITQYYEPFARHGQILLRPRDGIAAEDGEEGVRVGIRQVQMEQDTAKTLAQPGDAHWIDFNRVGVPLVEIITQPEIHHPATAAALVRKVQALLGAVDACVSGMESGGLRADVNVSVRRTDDRTPDAPLGQRTEIKNLSSFKAVEDAIIAERDRQIAVLEAGGTIAGETRGWSVGQSSTQTRRLRGKEGEVDYRYMPDPDIPPLLVGADLVAHLRATLGALPDAVVDGLVRDFGLSAKDAMALASLDGGLRVEYFFTVVAMLRSALGPDLDPLREEEHRACFQLAANWILHELGRLTSERSDGPAQDLGFFFSAHGNGDADCARVPARHLADLLLRLYRRDVTAKVAKELLWAVFRGRVPHTHASVAEAIEKEGLWFRELSAAEYVALADEAVAGQEDVLRQFVVAADTNKTFPLGKLMFLVGRMIRLGPEERIDPKRAEDVMRGRIEGVYVPRLKLKG